MLFSQRKAAADVLLLQRKQFQRRGVKCTLKAWVCKIGQIRTKDPQNPSLASLCTPPCLSIATFTHYCSLFATGEHPDWAEPWDKKSRLFHPISPPDWTYGNMYSNLIGYWGCISTKLQSLIGWNTCLSSWHGKTSGTPSSVYYIIIMIMIIISTAHLFIKLYWFSIIPK